jgi:hypothetical protein
VATAQTTELPFITATALVAALVKGQAEGRFEEHLAFCATPRLLMLIHVQPAVMWTRQTPDCILCRAWYAEQPTTLHNR